MNEASDGTRRPGAKRRVVPIVILSALVLIACLITQMGAISDALSQSASPSHAMLVGINASSSDHSTVSGLSGRDGSVRWRRRLDLTYTSGLVTDGAVYVAGLMHGKPTEEPTVIEALRLSDGATLWRLAFPEAPSTILHMLADNGLLIMTIDTVTAVNIVAINLSTHMQAWNINIFDFSMNWGYRALAASAGLLYVGTMDGSVQAYRLSDGRLAWTTHVSDSKVNDQWIWMIAVDDALLTYDSRGSLSRLRQSDGAVLWARTLSLSPASDAQTVSASSSVALCSAGSLSVPSRPVIIDPATGVTLRSYQHDCTGPTPIVSGAYIYMLESYLLTVLRASDGALLWRAEPAERELGYSNLASDSGVIFVSTVVLRYSVLSLCAHVWIASIGSCPSQTYIAAFDGATGKRYWRTVDSYDVLLGVAHP